MAVNFYSGMVKGNECFVYREFIARRVWTSGSMGRYTADVGTFKERHLKAP